MSMSLKKAGGINFISKYAVVIIQILINSILARLISPSEFGIVAVITVFTTFFSVFSDMGVSSGIIQFKSLNNEDYSNIFSFTVYFGIFLAIVFSLFSNLISFIYTNEIYSSLGIIISISIFFNTINAVPQALLLKNQKFIIVGVRTVVIALICGIITIILAILGFSYYAVVLNSVFTSLFIFLWNYHYNKIRFKFMFSLKSLKVIFSFSSFQFLFNLVNYFSRNLDNLLIGKCIGEEQLGIYDKSYKLTSYSLNVIPGIISPILHPILSNYQKQKDKMYYYFLNVLKIIMLIGAFIQPFLYYASKEIIVIMYGSNWSESIICFQFLSLSLFAQFSCTITGAIFQSLGKTKTMFAQCLLTTFITVTFICVGVTFKSIEMISICVSIAYNVNFFIVYFILIKVGFELKLKNFIKKIFFSIVVLIVMTIITFTIQIRIDSIFLALIVKILVLGVPFTILVLIAYKYKYFHL